MSDNTTENAALKSAICDALRAYIHTRPGFELANYMGAWSAYRADSRTATRQLRDAWTLLLAVQHNPAITGAQLAAELSRGRLTWDGERLEFTPCQYYPTEFRAAACRVLSSVLWGHVRETLPPPQYVVAGERSYPTVKDAEAAAGAYLPAVVSIEERYNGQSGGDYLRAYFRREFGPGLAGRWFN